MSEKSNIGISADGKTWGGCIDGKIIEGITRPNPSLAEREKRRQDQAARRQVKFEKLRATQPLRTPRQNPDLPKTS